MSSPSSPPSNRPRPEQRPQPRPEDDDEVARPVIVGLVALLAVAVTVGVLVGVAALVGARVAGVDSTTSAESTAAAGKGKETLYLPKPTMSEDDTGPSISLAPGETATSNSQPSSSATEQEQSEITLQGPSSVQPMANIDLTGVYPGGEGAVLQVQRFEEGKWVDFLSVNALVSNSTYSTYVQTSRPGPMKWRMIDTSNGKTSNPITVTVES